MEVSSRYHDFQVLTNGGEGSRLTVSGSLLATNTLSTRRRVYTTQQMDFGRHMIQSNFFFFAIEQYASCYALTLNKDHVLVRQSWQRERSLAYDGGTQVSGLNHGRGRQTATATATTTGGKMTSTTARKTMEQRPCKRWGKQREKVQMKRTYIPKRDLSGSERGRWKFHE